MDKTLEQIYAEFGKVPPEQSIREEKELKEKIGASEYMKQYYEMAMKNKDKHWNPERFQK